jgi:hypothetical protein
MALLRHGLLTDLAVQAKASALEHRPALKGIKTFNEMVEASRDLAPGTFELITSTDARGVYLKGIKLLEGFEGFLQRIFKKTNDIYFVAWAWDLSGEPITQYPGERASPKDVLIPLKVGKVREFIGSGILLFPKRKVTGGIALRIQLWESDMKSRELGSVLADTADAISKSDLNNLLGLISTATGVTGATINLVKNAAIELTKSIGTILKTNGDDYVDFFEGYYPADMIWTTGPDKYAGNASELTLEKG